MAANSNLKEFTKGIIKENPTLVLLLGTCPTLAISSSALDSLGMGIAAALVLICSNTVIAALKKFIPDSVRIPAFITIIASFVSVVQMLVKAYVPSLDKSLGIFLPLIVVNCIILGRAEAYASKNSVGLSALDGLGMGSGFTAALLLMGGIREFLGKGTIFNWPNGGLIPPITIFVLPAGGFFVFGMLIWLANRLSDKFDDDASRRETNENVCAACPSAAFCHQTVESETSGLAAAAITKKEADNNE